MGVSHVPDRTDRRASQANLCRNSYRRRPRTPRTRRPLDSRERREEAQDRSPGSEDEKRRGDREERGGGPRAAWCACGFPSPLTRRRSASGTSSSPPSSRGSRADRRLRHRRSFAARAASGACASISMIGRRSRSGVASTRVVNTCAWSGDGDASVWRARADSRRPRAARAGCPRAAMAVLTTPSAWVPRSGWRARRACASPSATPRRPASSACRRGFARSPMPTSYFRLSSDGSSNVTAAPASSATNATPTTEKPPPPQITKDGHEFHRAPYQRRFAGASSASALRRRPIAVARKSSGNGAVDGIVQERSD